MAKSALILGAIAFILILGAGLLSPLCTPCVALLAGLIAGWLAAYFERPTEGKAGASVGAQAGALAGIGALIGQFGAALINSLIMGPKGAAEFFEMLGLEQSGATFSEADYWLGVLGSAVCCSFVNVLLMAALGALGGYIWFKISGPKNPDQGSF